MFCEKQYFDNYVMCLEKLPIINNLGGYSDSQFFFSNEWQLVVVYTKWYSNRLKCQTVAESLK